MLDLSAPPAVRTHYAKLLQRRVSGDRREFEWPAGYAARWRAFHEWTLEPVVDPALTMRKAHSLVDGLCPKCHAHWVEWWQLHTLDCSSTWRRFIGGVEAHNAVSDRLNKPTLSPHDAIRLYLPEQRLASVPFVSRGQSLQGLNGLYAGRTAFLIGGGPSLASVDPAAFKSPGIMSMAINNAATVLRPSMWIACDEADRFAMSIWRDSSILKFYPANSRQRERLFDANTWAWTTDRAENAPGVVAFPLDQKFDPSNWLASPAAHWGESEQTTMAAALRILIALGFKRIVLVGCDWRMSADRPYAFDQGREDRLITRNNALYSTWNRRFDILRPHLERAGISVLNATPGSQLKAFDSIDLDQALHLARQELGVEITEERVSGLYDQPKPERDPKPQWAIAEPLPGACIIVGVDESQEDLLPWWHANVRRHNPDVPIVIADFGMSPAARMTARAMGKVVLIPRVNPQHAWFGKAHAILQGTHEAILWLDVDCEVRGDLSPLWRDHLPAAGVAMAPDPPQHPRSPDMGNSGVVLVRHGDDQVREWARRNAETQLYGDQDVIYRMGARPTLPQTYNWLRLIDGYPDAPEAIVVHHTGREGKSWIRARQGRSF